MFKDLLKKIKSRIYIITVWAIIISASVFLITSTFAATIYNVKEKSIVVLNYYDTPIEVKINDDIYLVEKFDIFTKKIKKDEAITLETFDSTGKTIDKVKFDKLGLQQKLILNVASKSSVYCFAQANVISHYYNSNAESVIQDFSTLTNFAKNTYLGELDNKTEYVFPGKASQSDLPTELASEELIGIYPINCSEITESKFTQLVDLYKGYNANDQRNFYNQETQRINNSTTLEELLN